MESIRLNKFVSNSGLCTRREAAHRIKAGMIKVNDVIVKDPATLIDKNAHVTFGKKVLTLPLDYTYILINKPKNTLSQNAIIDGEKTVAKILGNKVSAPVQTVGSIDKNDTGLILLTDDIELKSKLELINNKGEVIYHVSLENKMTAAHMATLVEHNWIENIHIRRGGQSNEIEIDVSLNRYNDLKSAIEKLGYRIHRLDRLYYAGLTKKDLSRDRFRHLTDQEVIMLKHFT